MRKRRVCLALLILAVGVVVGWLVVGAFREREPEYGGKRLSEWVAQYAIVSETLPPASRETEEAAHAIRHIGTNAVPYLLEWLGYEPPAWKSTLYQALDPILEHINPSWQVPDKKEIRAVRTAEVFRLLAHEREGSWLLDVLTNNNARKFIPFFIGQLGTNSRSVIPALRHFLNDSDPKIRTIATNELWKIDPELLDPKKEENR